MNAYPPDHIEGQRVVLRMPMIDDAGTLFQRVARDREVTKYLLWTPHPDVAATRRVLAQKLNVTREDRTWVIALRHSDDVVGMASWRCSARHSVEIGSCMGRRWWGKGLMSDVLAMLLAALEADQDVYRVWATCNVDNERTVRLLQRFGFVLEGRLARHAVYPNLGPEPRDSFLYAKVLR